MTRLSLLATLALLAPLSVLGAELPWTSATSLGTGASPTGLRLGDLNADGLLDVATAYNSAAGLVGYLGTGGGGASASTLYAPGGGFLHVHLADLLGDGTIDAVVGDPAGDSWRLLSNDGSAGFAVAKSGIGSAAATSFDADHDGDVDLYVLTDELYNTIFRGGFQNGNDGTGPSGNLYFYDDLASDFYDLERGDLDGDGDEDMVLICDAGVVALFNGRGDATDLNADWTPVTIGGLDGGRDLHVADLDGDGDLDIVAASAGGSGAAVVWFANSGLGVFGAPQTLLASPSDVNDLDAADIDHDGDVDLLLAEDSGVYLLENQGASFVRTPVAAGYGSAVAARFGDLDADGDLDVAAASDSSNDTVWFGNLSLHRAVQFGATTVINGALSDEYPFDMADLDGDGDLDFLGAQRGTGIDSFFWQENLSNGAAFGPATTVVSGLNQTIFAAAADLNADGNPDYFAVANLSTQRWVPGDGQGGFGSEVAVSTSSSTSRQVAFGDIDGNGTLDYARGRNNGGQVRVELNDGDGASWTGCEIDVFNGHAANDVAVGDIDGDGDLDVISAVNTNSLSGEQGLYWHRNSPGAGCGTWTRIALVPPGTLTGFSTLELGDVDRDGDLDLVARINGATSWFENPGAPLDIGGNWSASPITTSYDGGVSSLVDIDLDGDLDLVQSDATNNSGAVVWIENLDGFGFSWSANRSPNLDDPDTTQLFDVDGDGIDDFVFELDDGYSWMKVSHQQAGATESDVAPLSIEELESQPVLSIALDHTFGDAGDVDIELGELSLFLHDGSGVALSDADANSVFDGISVWRDDGDGVIGGADLLLEEVTTFTLTGGVLFFDLPQGVPGGSVAAGTTGDYLIVVDIAGTAIAGGVSTAGVDLLPGEGLIRHAGTEAPVVLDGSPAGVSSVSFDIDPLDSDDDGDPDTSDCEEGDPSIYTGAAELCNGVDDDCDTGVDEVFDTDGDGVTSCGPDGTPGTSDDDCDDAIPTTFPGATETCNGADDDCDGTTDEGFDVDADSFLSCGANGIPGDADDDCDDSSSLIYPGAAEFCDFFDYDCDGDLVDTFTNSDTDALPDCVDTDDDDDGDPDSTDCSDANPSIYNGAPEVCDNTDSDCDGSLVDAFTNTDGDVLPDCVDLDDDGDGLPDDWEIANGLDSLDASDASSDTDLDGRVATVELADGTDPNLYEGPGAPSNASPGEGDFVTSTTPLLEANNATHPLGDVMTYTFEVYSDAALTALVVSEAGVASGVPTTSWTVDSALAEDTDFWWRVAASDAYVTGPFGAASSLHVDSTGQAPNVPTLLFPLLGVSMEEAEEELVLEGSVSPEGHEVEYSFELYDGAGTTLLASDAVQGGADGEERSWPIDITLTVGDLYSWRARAEDPAGRASEWTELEVFGYRNANADPSQPVFISPSDGGEVGTLSPELVVAESTDPEGSLVLHTFLLDTEESFVDAVPFSVLGTGAEQLRVDLSTVNGGISLTPNVTWYASVLGTDANGQESPADTISFLVRGDNDPPSTPSPLLPTDRYVTSQNPELTATPVSDPEGDTVVYHFQVSQDAGFVAVSAETTSAAEPRFGVAEDLAGGYWWRVRAVDSLGAASAWSSPRYFVAEDPSWGSCAMQGRSGARGGWLLLPLAALLLRRRRASVTR